MLKGKLTIKTKKDGYTIDKRNIKKVLKHEDTTLKCEEYYTDDYLYDLQNDFNRDIKKEEILEDLYYYTICYQNDKIKIYNSFSSYIIENKNLTILTN